MQQYSVLGVVCVGFGGPVGAGCGLGTLAGPDSAAAICGGGEDGADVGEGNAAVDLLVSKAKGFSSSSNAFIVC